MKFFPASLLLVVALQSAVGAAPTREPRNLDQAKEELRAYVSSGDYAREIAAVAAQARAWIEERAAKRAPGERLTAIFDLDETLLSNWPQIQAQNFGGDFAAWRAWYEKAQCPPIEPVREVYRAARRFGVEVVFLTGRPERLRECTEKNLQNIDCGEYGVLLCKPNDWQATTAAFKTAQRKQLVEAGRVIIANLGDQESDLVGGFAERTFRLPDPFYFSP